MGKRPKRPLSELVRLFIWHWTLGFLLSAGLVAAILYFNFNGLGRLLLNEPLAIFMLWFFMGSTFAGVQTAMTVMNMADDDETGGRRKPETSGLKAILARAKRPHRADPR